MIILDTNVISEAMRGPRAEPRVLSWLRNVPGTPVTTVVNRAEIMAGLAQLPVGSRRTALSQVAVTVFDELHVALPLTAECADHYGDIVAHRRRAGHPIGGMDALIAAIARETGATIATRDLSDFRDLDLTLTDPWA